MKIEYSKFLVLLVIILFLSCSNDRQDERIKTLHSTDRAFTVRTFFTDGSIKTEASYNSDSLLHGEVLGYYPNGKLKVVKNYLDGKKEGLTKGFFQNGEIEYIGKYENDKKDSTWIWYRQKVGNLKLNAVENFLNGRHFGGQLEFDSTGHLTLYKLFNLDGLIGTIKFNERQFQIEGNLCYIWYNRDILETGKELTILLYAGVPPGWKSKFKPILIKNNKEIQTKEICKIINVAEKNIDKYQLTCVIDNPGNYLVKTALEITNEYGVPVYSDTLTTDIVFQKK